MKMPPRLLSLPDLDASTAEAAPELSSNHTPVPQAAFPDTVATLATISAFPAGFRDTNSANTRSVMPWRVVMVAAGVGLAVSAVWWQASLRTTSELVRENGDGWRAASMSPVVKGSLRDAKKGWAYRSGRKASVPIRWPDRPVEINRLQTGTNTETPLSTNALPEPNVRHVPAAMPEQAPGVLNVPAPGLSATKPAVLGVPVQKSDPTLSADAADLLIQPDADIGGYIDTTRKPEHLPGRRDPIRR
ncbi:MAG: hypothetical protein VX346_11000 [Planctomycetota bacterium]|nr:hypothetical protein [Planctomycetota bacterium]